MTMRWGALDVVARHAIVGSRPASADGRLRRHGLQDTWTTARGRSFRGRVSSGANLATEAGAACGVKITRGFLHAALQEPGRPPPVVAAGAPEVVHRCALRA